MATPGGTCRWESQPGAQEASVAGTGTGGIAGKGGTASNRRSGSCGASCRGPC